MQVCPEGHFVGQRLVQSTAFPTQRARALAVVLAAGSCDVLRLPWPHLRRLRLADLGLYLVGTHHFDYGANAKLSGLGIRLARGRVHLLGPGAHEPAAEDPNPAESEDQKKPSVSKLGELGALLGALGCSPASLPPHLGAAKRDHAPGEV